MHRTRLARGWGHDAWEAWICDEEVLREGSNTAPQTLERKLKVEEPFKLFIRNIIFIRRKKKRINIWQFCAFFIYSLFFVYSHWKYLRINIGFWGSDGSFANKLTLAFFIRRVYSYYETALRIHSTYHPAMGLCARARGVAQFMDSRFNEAQLVCLAS